MSLPGFVVLAPVVLGLAITAWAQARPMTRYRQTLDALAIVPEWRFYAQASLAAAVDFARDVHLVTRDRDALGTIGGWRPVLWSVERRPGHALWNPHGLVDVQILSLAEDLARACAGRMPPNVQQSIPYLVLLRRALEAPRAPGGAVDRQFGVVHTVGREHRDVVIDFLSAWHRW